MSLASERGFLDSSVWPFHRGSFIGIPFIGRQVRPLLVSDARDRVLEMSTERTERSA